MENEPFILSQLSWPEAKAAFPAVEVVLIPVGSNEQHGPNIAVQCDIALATAFCERLSARMRPRVMVAPPVPWGISPHHMRFPGTITLTPETFIAVLKEVVGSLMQHGLKRFLIVNGHGGNTATLGVAVWEIRTALQPNFIGSCSYFSMFDPKLNADFPNNGAGGHACGQETSYALALRPDLVKHDTLAAMEPAPNYPNLRPLAQRYGLTIPAYFDEYTLNGCLGDARLASEAYGNAMVASGLERMSELVEAIIQDT